MVLHFVDKNKELTDKARKLFAKFTTNKWDIGLKVTNDDIFKHNGVVVTASNPDFDMSGGLDLAIAEKYPDEFANKREFLKTEHLFYAISVNEKRKSSKELILRALAGVFLHYSNTHETILLSGLGTGIGGLAIQDFLDTLERVLSANLIFVNLSFANLSSANLRFANLRFANLSSADLISADLSFANLHSANLHSANLRFANLSFANLSYTEFDGLTVREFIQNYNLKITKGKVILFKGLDSERKGPILDKIEYKKGEIVVDEIVNYRVNDECAHGLHVCPTQELAKRFGSNVVRVEVDIMDFVAIPNDGSKVRVKQLKVLD